MENVKKLIQVAALLAITYGVSQLLATKPEAALSQEKTGTVEKAPQRIKTDNVDIIYQETEKGAE